MYVHILWKGGAKEIIDVISTHLQEACLSAKSVPLSIPNYLVLIVIDIIFEFYLFSA